MPSDMNISLEQHLRDTLSTLAPVLPANITLDLTAPTVPYSELQEISKWSRTEEGQKAAKGVDCSMIALLAGSTTSPERRFAPVEKRVDDSKRELNDRKAVVAVVNSLLSIGGSGMASWWAAGVIGWRDEWVSDDILYSVSVIYRCLLESVVRAVRCCCCRHSRRSFVCDMGLSHDQKEQTEWAT